MTEASGLPGGQPERQLPTSDAHTARARKPTALRATGMLARARQTASRTDRSEETPIYRTESLSPVGRMAGAGDRVRGNSRLDSTNASTPRTTELLARDNCSDSPEE